jgi:hypothetical protein
MNKLLKRAYYAERSGPSRGGPAVKGGNKERLASGILALSLLLHAAFSPLGFPLLWFAPAAAWILARDAADLFVDPRSWMSQAPEILPSIVFAGLLVTSFLCWAASLVGLLMRRAWGWRLYLYSILCQVYFTATSVDTSRLFAVQAVGIFVALCLLLLTRRLFRR